MCINGKYAIVYATYELTGINHLTRSCIQMMMMVMQGNDDDATVYLHSELATWPNLSKTVKM